MTKEIIKSLAEYNTWANKKIMDFILLLDKDVLDKEVENSFSTLRKTIYHIWDAQVIWLNRLNYNSISEWPSKAFDPSIKGFEIYFIQQSYEIENWLSMKTDMQLNQYINYNTIIGKEEKNTAWEICLHCFNHSTYHRGQVITMLHSLKKESLPSTDYILFIREKNKFHL